MAELIASTRVCHLVGNRRANTYTGIHYVFGVACDYMSVVANVDLGLPSANVFEIVTKSQNH